MTPQRELVSPKVVLVVDDEPVVLNVVCNMLAQGGFEVLRAESPQAALRIAAEYQRPIHLLLADVILPGPCGPEVAGLFAERHPEAQWLFMAGLPDHPAVDLYIRARGLAFLAKPFVHRTLLEKVNQMLFPKQAVTAQVRLSAPDYNHPGRIARL